MKTSSPAIVFLCILLLLMIPVDDINYDKEDYLDIVTKSFQATNAQIYELNIEAWAQISQKGFSLEELETIYKELANSLNIPNQPQINTEYQDFISFNQIEKINNQTNIHISLQSFLSQGQESGVFLGIQVISEDLTAGRKFYDLAYKTFSLFNKQSNVGVTLTGTFPKFLEKNEQHQIIALALTSVNGEVKEGISTDELISLSAYTKNCPNFFEVNGEKINLNIAIRYHSLDDKTYLHIGAPLIFQEY